MHLSLLYAWRSFGLWLPIKHQAKTDQIDLGFYRAHVILKVLSCSSSNTMFNISLQYVICRLTSCYIFTNGCDITCYSKWSLVSEEGYKSKHYELCFVLFFLSYLQIDIILLCMAIWKDDSWLTPSQDHKSWSWLKIFPNQLYTHFNFASVRYLSGSLSAFMQLKWTYSKQKNSQFKFYFTTKPC